LHIVSNVSHLGELRSLCDRAPALIASAYDRGDVYGATALVLRAAFLMALIRDDPHTAAEDLSRAESAWSGRREFLLQHYWGTMARLDVLAYEGNGAAAYALLEQRWRQFIAAQMRRVQFTRVESSYRRARSAVMWALDPSSAPSQRTRLLQDARRHCRVLLNEPMDWSIGLGHLVFAGAMLSQGDERRALTSLKSAEERFESAGMALHAVLSRRARGRLIGGDQGRSLCDASDAWLRAQGVVNCTSMSRMIAGWM
jgi:hypothetical protein